MWRMKRTLSVSKIASFLIAVAVIGFLGVRTACAAAEIPESVRCDTPDDGDEDGYE